MKLSTGLQVQTREGGESLHELQNLKLLEELEALRKVFEAGDKGALFAALVLCAHFQAVMPDWLADALLESEKRFENGEIAHIGEIFGPPPKSKAQRKAAARYRVIERDCLHLLGKSRKQGYSFNADECFGSIKNELGCGRRDVEAIYKAYKPMLSAIKKEGFFAEYASVHMVLTYEDIFPRRRGRKIVE